MPPSAGSRIEASRRELSATQATEALAADGRGIEEARVPGLPLALEQPAPAQADSLAATKTTHLLHALQEHFSQYASVLVAFSGGVDSALVAFLAHSCLGKRALAVTSASPSLTRADLALASSLTQEWGLAHRVVHTRELEDSRYRANPLNRCYYCKTALYDTLRQIAAEEGYGIVLNGTNLDDLQDHRPGLLAAEEYAVRAPLSECGLNKAAVRAVARQLGLRNAEKPQAACLSSRVAYGLSISEALLARIERAESVLRRRGFTQVRVRHHGEIARIEVLAEELPQLLEQRQTIDEALRACGYRHVTVDLRGFRSGSLNEGLGLGAENPGR